MLSCLRLFKGLANAEGEDEEEKEKKDEEEAASFYDVSLPIRW